MDALRRCVWSWVIKDVIAAGDPSDVRPSNASPSPASLTPGKLDFAYPEPPAPGHTIEVAPGILWARLSLPFLLDHVNIYFIDDGDGWALIDTGLGNKATQAAWQPLLDSVLTHRPLTRIIATHFHPDHVGAAGFLLERFDVPLSCRPRNICNARFCISIPARSKPSTIAASISITVLMRRRRKASSLADTLISPDVGTAADLPSGRRRRRAAYRRTRIRRAHRRRTFARKRS